jgi:hypothetical protein
MHYVKHFLLIIIIDTEDVVLARLAEARNAVFLAAEFVAELKLVCATLDALIASDGKPTATPE